MPLLRESLLKGDARTGGLFCPCPETSGEVGRIPQLSESISGAAGEVFPKHSLTVQTSRLPDDANVFFNRRYLDHTGAEDCVMIGDDDG
jgi:hypothetical protein